MLHDCYFENVSLSIRSAHDVEEKKLSRYRNFSTIIYNALESIGFTINGFWLNSIQIFVNANKNVVM